MGAQPVFLQTPGLGLVQILPADTSTVKTLVTGAANGTKVSSLNLSSTDTSARIVQVTVTRSATVYILGSFTVPIVAGTDGVTSSINAFGSSLLPGLPVDNDGNPYLLLANGDILGINTTTTVTTAQAVSAAAVKADF